MSELEHRLTGLTGGYPFPATPDLAEATRARIMPERPRRGTRMRLALALALAAFAAAGALALSSSARSGLVDLLDFVPGVRIEHVEELPTMAVTESDSFGTEIALDEAARRCCCRSPSATPTMSTAAPAERSSPCTVTTGARGSCSPSGPPTRCSSTR